MDAVAGQLADAAAHTPTDYDIGRLLAHLFHGEYRYMGNELWLRYETGEAAWQPDVGGARFAKAARYRLHAVAMERALQWQTQANAAGAGDEEGSRDAHVELMGNRAEQLLHLSQFALSEVHMRRAIREARLWMDDAAAAATEGPRRKRIKSAP